MNQFFRISLAMAIIVCMTSCVQGGKAGQAAASLVQSGKAEDGGETAGAAAIALKTAKGGKDSDGQPAATPASAGSPAAAPGIAAMQTAGQLVVLPLTKMQTIIKNVTSCKYPYRCSAFAGDYCNRQCTVICAPPL